MVFKSRNCPICCSNECEVVIEITYEMIFLSNPTYRKEWFQENTVSRSHLFPIVECKSCGFIYSKFSLSGKMQFDYYNQAIDENLSKEKIFKRKKRSGLITHWEKLHSLSDNSLDCVKVLDFGAGWGDFLAVARSPGVEVIGLEFDERKINYARSLGIQVGDLDFVKSKAPYDIFMCNQVLEHLDNPKEALQTLRQLTKTGAVGFISVPDFNKNRMLKEIQAIKRKQSFSKDVDPLGHLNYFSPESFYQLLEEFGFQKVFPVQPKDMPRGSLVKLIYNFKEMIFSRKQKNTKVGSTTTSLYVRSM